MGTNSDPLATNSDPLATNSGSGTNSWFEQLAYTAKGYHHKLIDVNHYPENLL